MKISMIFININRIVVFKFIILMLLVTLSACHSNLNEVIITSPNNINTVRILIDEGKLLYRVNHENKKIILPSKLGFIFNHDLSLSNDFKLLDTKFSKVDQT